MGVKYFSMSDSHHPETISIHAGRMAAVAHGDVMPPIHLSTTFERQQDGTFRDHIYTRSSNPNRTQLETKLAALEGGQVAVAFSSGMAAVNAAFNSMLKPGDHVVIPDDCYHGTRELANEIFARWGVEVSNIDMSDLRNVEKALKPNTRLIWIETPSNPQLKVTDVSGVIALARTKGLLVGCDNTFATPVWQRPLAMGADVVMHATTKFFSGHSDVLGGVLVLREAGELSARIQHYQQIAGAVPSPFDCWLLNRSLSTFSLRVRQQTASAGVLADFFASHPRIEKVFYPGLASHLNHDIARRQMTGYGSMLSILIKGDRDAAMTFAGKLRVFRHATSLGGVESLVEHRRTAEGAHPVSPDNLLRISVGVEHVDDLLGDLKQALA